MPIYASNTAEQCEFIIRDAGAKLVIVEDAAQRDKLLPLRHRLFTVARLVQMGGEQGGRRQGRRFRASRWRDAVARDAAAAGWQAHPAELDAHAETVSARLDVHDHLHLGHDGDAQGRGADAREPHLGVCSAVRAMQVNEGDEQYLFLPLAHVLARQTIWVGFEAGCHDLLARDDPRSRRTWSRCGRPSWPASRASTRSSTPASARGSKQGSALKQSLAAWAVRAGKAHAAAPARRRPSGRALDIGIADKLVLSQAARAAGARSLPLPDLGRRAAGRRDRRVLPRASAS